MLEVEVVTPGLHYRYPWFLDTLTGRVNSDLFAPSKRCPKLNLFYAVSPPLLYNSTLCFLPSDVNDWTVGCFILCFSE